MFQCQRWQVIDQVRKNVSTLKLACEKSCLKNFLVTNILGHFFLFRTIIVHRDTVIEIRL